MQALVKFAAGPGNMELRDVPIPQRSGEVQIAVRASICGSDLHIRKGDIGIQSLPGVPHEFAGGDGAGQNDKSGLAQG